MADNRINSILRNLPSVNDMLLRPRISKAIAEEVPRFLIIKSIQDSLSQIREKLLISPNVPVSDQGNLLDSIEDQILEMAAKRMRCRLLPVINGTGVILHTNLGRALLPQRAVDAVSRASAAYTSLEMDLDTGLRGQRSKHVEELLCQLTGAESAIVVNNNAAAVLLTLSTMASGCEALVSRGQLVEIGGSFRVPDVMTQSGVALVEVGTTNKTHAEDFTSAICDKTALLLRVHTSNYRIIGFTQEVALEEMVKIGRQHSIPVMDDLGSGVLVDLTQWGLPYEPMVQDSIRSGADIVTFSGDKLMGGPQAGIILGKKEYLDKMKKNPLLRALRLDKMTLAALEEILYIYLESSDIDKEIPVLSMLTASREELGQKAIILAKEINRCWESCGEASVCESTSLAGGGSLPEAEIPTWTVSLQYHRLNAKQLEDHLRACDPPILGRIEYDKVMIDLRTLLPGDEKIIIAALEKMHIQRRTD